MRARSLRVSGLAIEFKKDHTKNRQNGKFNYIRPVEEIVLKKQGARIVTSTSWGTKRNCPKCSTHFYDLNKTPATCPKCGHSFDPAVVVRGKRKPARREAPEAKAEIIATVLAQKTPSLRKKTAKGTDAEPAAEGGIGDIAEMEDVDDIENLQELSELEEMEDVPVNEDDADDEAIIEELNTGGKALVGNVEEEEASVLVKEMEEEEQKSSAAKKAKPKAKKKPK